MIDLIGYAGDVVLVVSYLYIKHTSFVYLQLIASLFLLTYALLINSIPVVMLNLIIIAILIRGIIWSKTE